MSDINLQPLFEYLDEHFKEVREDIAQVKENVQVLQTSVDGLAKMVKDFQDVVALSCRTPIRHPGP